MNKKAITLLANFMENSPLEFDMDTSYAEYDVKSSCGTAGCIAGFAAVLWPQLRISSHVPGSKASHHCNFIQFGELLELDDQERMALTSPTESLHGVDYSDGSIDRAWAIRTLRHLVDTGKVDWMATRESE